MQAKPRRAQRLALVEAAFRSLPERYLGAEADFHATYHVVLGDVGHIWEVRCNGHGARVCKGASRREPDVTITTDSRTWLALREGKFSGIEAFQRRLLTVRGNLDYAVAFEALFTLPNGRPPLLEIQEVHVDRHRVSTLSMGQGPDVLLLHGLGGTRASLFETGAALAPQYRVHLPDLPGFGSSGKPAFGGYNSSWFASIMLGLMDELAIPQAFVVGNSMGGRIAIEMGLVAPERIVALGLLCPAVAWIRRGLHPIVRLLRPELGLLPHGFRRSVIASQFWSLFSDRSVIDPAVAELMVDEFRRIYHTAGARYAFLSSARNIYLERPFGEGGFYPRLSTLTVPSLFIWADRDNLVPAAFTRHVASWLPDAEQVTISACGHVPQVERPEETNELLMDFFARAGRGEAARAVAPKRATRRQSRAA
jgi:pimeloyl-ACP methyl ester carboxylesterase